MFYHALFYTFFNSSELGDCRKVWQMHSCLLFYTLSAIDVGKLPHRHTVAIHNAVCSNRFAGQRLFVVRSGVSTNAVCIFGVSLWASAYFMVEFSRFIRVGNKTIFSAVADVGRIRL